MSSFSIWAGVISLGLEPVQASPTASSAIFGSFSLNSSSWIPKSFRVRGMFICLLKSWIFFRRLLISACLELPSSPILLAISAYLSAGFRILCVVLDYIRQIDGICTSVRNMACREGSSCFMSHRMDNAQKRVGECHSCQTLCIVHLLSCVHIHVVGSRQVVQDHFDGLKSQGICERTMQGRHISLNGMGQGIHSGVSYLLYRKAGYQIRIYDSNVRSNIKIRQWVFYTCMIIGNNGESSYFCCSSGSRRDCCELCLLS